MTFEALGSQRSTDGRRRIQYESGRTASCVVPAAAKDKRKHLADPLFRRLSRFTEDLLHPGDLTQRAFCCWLSALHCIWTGSSLFPRSCRKTFFGGVRRCFLSQHFCSSKLLLYEKSEWPCGYSPSSMWQPHAFWAGMCWKISRQRSFHLGSALWLVLLAGWVVLLCHNRKRR